MKGRIELTNRAGDLSVIDFTLQPLLPVSNLITYCNSHVQRDIQLHHRRKINHVVSEAGNNRINPHIFPAASQPSPKLWTKVIIEFD